MRLGLIILAVALVLGGAGGWFYLYGERSIHGLSGPTIGKGNATEPIGELALDAIIPGLAGYNMRARYVVVTPRGVIRIHNHTGRPAFSYIVAGAVDEYRSDVDGPISHKPGVFTADSNIAQWWRSTSDESARWYVVDIYKRAGGPSH